ncbi:MAG: hypothetical protein RI988_2435 [Pseudomonadota bacterium]|jgi:hypothetical protein
MLSGERLALPRGERMGLLGGSLLFEVSPGWWAGPAVYGAATGERAGLFVGGFELQRRVRLADRLTGVAGLYAGGGGGGAAPVGDGLLVRPAASLLWDFGGWQAGMSVSGARFAGTEVGGTQLGLMLAWDGRYRHTDPLLAGRALTDARGSGLGFQQAQLSLVSWQLQDGSGRRIGLASARMLRPLGASAWSAGVEMGAAATGGAGGYMEILGSLGLGWEPAAGLQLGVRGALGLGGGGALATGGGGLAKASAHVGVSPLPGWTLGAEAGLVRGAGSMPRARSLQLWVGHELQPPPGAGASGRVAAYEWTAGVQRMTRAARRDGRSGPVELVTGKIERSLGPSLYLSAQAHSAFGGDAGAYSVGLLGIGWATPAAARGWRVGAELLAGAAGGASLDTGGGAIGQALLWGSLATGERSHVRAGFGRVRALQSGGGLDSPLWELSFSHRFGLGARAERPHR